MPPLPRDFLTETAKKYELSPEQQQAFVEKFSSDKSESAIAQTLHISPEAFRTRMSGVYSKFSIGGKGPNKSHRLRDLLLNEYQKSFPNQILGVSSYDIEARVQFVREKIKPDIEKRYGKMRILDMTHQIGLNDIYTDVNILEKITGRQSLEGTLQSQNCNWENFERFGLGVVTQKRVPGLVAAKQYSKLMILGKPGAGKTTFLKRIAIQCNLGEFFADRVPIFITLKEFAEAPEQPGLLQYINNQFAVNDISDQKTIEGLLYQGRTIVLLDGLDEVRQANKDWVLKEIRNFSTQYDVNSFVMTCRIAAQEYIFEQFTEVEIADFEDKQIAEFATKWFQAKDPNKAQHFIQKLQENKRVKQLATNPLLLTLLCLLFGESTNFPDNRSELYEQGLDVLLRKWDGTRGIERDQVYQRLSLKRKEDLLSKIALETFEEGNYFFKERQLEGYISNYIQNLPDAQTDPGALLLDSKVVLKSIEAQHGLLVERARKIYSFSHLTFHEFFTARNIALSRNPQQALQQLVSHITYKRWREVFLLTVGMLSDADDLLQLMKQQIDALLAKDEKLQQFLTWVKEKSDYVEAPYKPAAVRAFYHYLALDVALALYRDRARDLARAFYLARDLARALYQALAHNSELKRSLQHLKGQLSNTKGQAWTKKLRAVMIKDRNIGHNWQFSREQIDLLLQYYDANMLLADCLNSDCYVSRKVREDIEDKLLLPVNNKPSNN